MQATRGGVPGRRPRRRRTASPGAGAGGRRKLKRQLGCERRTGALPIVDRYPGGRELAWARILLLVTLTGFVVFPIEWVMRFPDQHGPMGIAEAWVYLASSPRSRRGLRQGTG